MDNIIDKTYRQALKGITEQLLDDHSAWYHYVLDLPIAQQVVYTVVLYNWQVENGGFHQYFFNSYGQFAYLTVENLKLINAFKKAQLLVDALADVNSDSLDKDEFRDVISKRALTKLIDFDNDLCDALNQLDDKYYAIENEDVFNLLEKYLSWQIP